MFVHGFNDMIDRRGTNCSQWDYIDDRFGGKDILPFAVSDMDVASPEPVLAAMKQRLEHPVMGYTRWQNSDYRNAVADWWQQRFDVDVLPEHVIYTPGILSTVAMLLEAWTLPGEGVIIQPPVYDAFAKIITANDRRVIENPLILENNWYSVDWKGLERIARSGEAKVLLLCSPHTPVGRVWSRAELDRLVEICREYKLYLISDEAHMDLVYREHRRVSVLSAVGQGSMAANAVVVSSAAKAFNLSGLGSGYAIVTHRGQRAELLQRVRKYGVYSANALAMTAVIAAYRHCGEWLNGLNKHIADNRRWLSDYILSDIKEIKLMPAEATYLPWLDCRRLFEQWGYASQRFAEANMEFNRVLLEDGKLLLKSGTSYGNGGQGFVRFNIGCARDKIREGMQRFKDIVKNYKMK